MSQPIHIFTYGTLMRGQCRSHVLARQKFLGDATTTANYVLVNLGDYPGLVTPTAFNIDAIDTGLINTALFNGRSIRGELYEVDARCLLQLDEIECIDEGLYRRAPVELRSHPNVGAVTYVYNRAVDVSQIMGDRWT